MTNRAKALKTSATTSRVASTARLDRQRVARVTVERFIHTVFGNNVVIGSHVLRQLDRLREVLPPDLRGRQVDDLGCGDGKLTVLLREILQPVRLRGFDVNPALVRRARSRGIDARVMNFEHSVPAGDLAVVWGVLHHLSDPARCLAGLRANYGSAFIREPIRGASRACLELGTPLGRHEFGDMVRRSLPGGHVSFYDDYAFVFCDFSSRSDIGSRAHGRLCVESTGRK
jgi:SAM-dependent methyltransferase